MKNKLHAKHARHAALQLALLSAFALAGWFTSRYAARLPLAVPAVFAALALFALWNTTPFAFKPNPTYKPTDMSQLHWPEAAPIEAPRKHDKLLFCVHGYPSTPADYRKIIALSEARGWDVAAPLLPGCGTSPDDFIHTEWSQYLAHVRSEWNRLRPLYRTACLVGTSMGGAVSLALAAELCAAGKNAPEGIATIGAPITLNSFLRHGMIAHPLIYAVRFLSLFIPSIGAAYPDPEGNPADGGAGWMGYDGIFTKQTYTLQVGFRQTEKKLGDVTCPALICHCRGDKTVPFKNASIIMSALGSQRIEAYTANMDGFDHPQHNLVRYDSQREKVWTAIINFFEAAIKNQPLV